MNLGQFNLDWDAGKGLIRVSYRILFSWEGEMLMHAMGACAVHVGALIRVCRFS